MLPREMFKFIVSEMAFSNCSFKFASSLSIRKLSRAWKFPWRLVSSVLSSLFPLRGTLFWPQKITVLIDWIF